MDPVVHFEMLYGNRELMAKFYESSFGWQTQMLGEGKEFSSKEFQSEKGVIRYGEICGRIRARDPE